MSGQGKAQETEHERHHRQLAELLEELRVMMPGVQFLFAFLLTVPFAQRFTTLSEFEEGLFYGVLLAAAAASACLIAPTAQHRMLFRKNELPDVIESGHRYATIGIAFVALAMTGATVLVSHMVFGRTEAIITAGVFVPLVAWAWFLSPLLRHASGKSADTA